MPVEKESELFINRELSWLEFNRRVLDLSRDKNVPLGEQLHFAGIYQSNLDEFFMLRVGSLYDQTLLQAQERENKTGMTPQQQLDAIMPRVDALQRVLDKSIGKLYGHLAAEGFAKVDFAVLNKQRLNDWKKYFLRELFPVLSPQIVDRRHPFPFLRDREIYVGALIKEKKREDAVFGLIPVSAQFERMHLLRAEGGTQFSLAEELILQFAEVAFGKSNVVEKCLFRVTRNADINVQEGMFDHDIDYREVMSELLKKRRKLAAVRLQFLGRAPGSIHAFLLDKLLLPKEQCFEQKTPLDVSFLHKLAGMLRGAGKRALFYPPARPLLPPAGEDLAAQVRRRDVLLCFPYQSMRPFIAMLYAAGRDADVISIKMTLYRVASDSKVVEALIAAAENGKEVVTIVELRARFDEQNNIDWSRRMEQAGCTVIYGFSDYKVHSKLALITRRQGAHYEYISCIGTGNYNESTSELYIDLAYLTCDAEIGEEVGAVFNNLAMERLTDHVNRLIVAPLRFKSVLIEEMRREMQYQAEGGAGHIILKCNAISDKAVIETLGQAAAAGVAVDLVVRGICCLQAGLPALAGNMQVRSLVGRYLEHSRLYAFGEGERMRLYIASGDFLTRNTERRVEVGLRVEDGAIRQMLRDVLEMQLADNVNASVMQPGGVYAKAAPGPNERAVDSQMAMYSYLERWLRAQERQDRARQKEKAAQKTARPPARAGWRARLRRLFSPGRH